MHKLVVLDPEDLKQIIRRRRKTGADRYDEVWDGVYVMSPIADNNHQRLASQFVIAIDGALKPQINAIVLAGTNVSDRKVKWQKNYRVPDVAVFLPGNPAEDMDAFWHGGPDFVVEVVSHRDRSRQKLDFYAAVGVRELLLVDRDPWALELYRLDGDHFERVDAIADGSLMSRVLPLRFNLTADTPTPKILVDQTIDGRRWAF
ncbi:Uma2 family endonuclease [Tundrisphaera sp. TA3]|uniref:Uma2 family endonuclease n=1 Tax=Tundrisphaera sp. TA3 TaxID=3435775 RepID=UPI003EB9BF13